MLLLAEIGKNAFYAFITMLLLHIGSFMLWLILTLSAPNARCQRSQSSCPSSGPSLAAYPACTLSAAGGRAQCGQHCAVAARTPLAHPALGVVIVCNRGIAMVGRDRDETDQCLQRIRRAMGDSRIVFARRDNLRIPR